MNTKYRSTGSVPSTLGRPVGVLPLGPRPAMPTGQKKSANSFERRGIKRTPSTSSVTSVASSRSLQSETNTPSSRRSSRSRPDPRERKPLAAEDYDEDGQDVRFYDCDTASVTSARSIGSARSVSSAGSTARREKKTLTTQEILEQCQETDPYKVFEIDLHGAELTQVPDLEKFRKLRLLDISGNHIKTLMGLEMNKDLRDIKVYDNRLSKIEGLENLKDLCNLQLQHNNITKIGRGLGNLKKLQTLRLDSNKISKIENPELLSCANISVLDLSNNQLETLSPLSYLPNLEELTASGNKIGKIGDLSKCKRLSDVDLSHNSLFDLTGIANLPNLKILDVSYNQLKCLKSVGKLKLLEELNINANRVTSLAPFVNAFPKLQILFVCDNMLASWEDVCLLSKLPEFVELFVSNNPFTLEDGEMPTYHLHISQALPGLEVIDGAQVKRPSGARAAPVMRPMSASSIISVRQVDSQMRSVTMEQEALQRSISDRFESLRSLFDKLPTEAPTPTRSVPPISLDERPMSSSMEPAQCESPTHGFSSRSRMRIKKAQQFAAENFDEPDAVP